jgi:hypothetical protein
MKKQSVAEKRTRTEKGRNRFSSPSFFYLSNMLPNISANKSNNSSINPPKTATIIKPKPINATAPNTLPSNRTPVPIKHIMKPTTMPNRSFPLVLGILAFSPHTPLMAKQR